MARSKVLHMARSKVLHMARSKVLHMARSKVLHMARSTVGLLYLPQNNAVYGMLGGMNSHMPKFISTDL